MATSFEPIKFANLTEKTTAPADADIVVIEDSTATKKAKWSNLISWIKSKLNIGSANISGIGDGTVTGAINGLNTKKANVQSGHTCEIGLSPITARPFPYINIDGVQIDLIPNNIDETANVKILNTKILYSTLPWQLQLEIYIDGAVYYKKVNLSD